MERVTLDRGSGTLHGAVVQRLSDPLGTADLALNHYRMEAGESLPAGLHTHADQEEVFVVLSGELAFETLLPPDVGDAGSLADYTPRDVRVSAGAVIRFAPGEFQSGRNAIDGETSVLAIGAPRGTDDIRLPIGCPACSNAPLRLRTDGGVSFECLDCGAGHVPSDCPECGHADLRVVLGDEQATVVECQGCGSRFDEPPVED